MPQRKQLTWAELRVGLFVLAGLFIMAVAIFYVTGAGILGPKYRIITYLPGGGELDHRCARAAGRLGGRQRADHAVDAKPIGQDAQHRAGAAHR